MRLPIITLLLLAGCGGPLEYTPTHVCKNVKTGQIVNAEWFNGTRFRYIDHNGVSRSITEENSDDWNCERL